MMTILGLREDACLRQSGYNAAHEAHSLFDANVDVAKQIIADGCNAHEVRILRAK